MAGVRERVRALGAVARGSGLRCGGESLKSNRRDTRTAPGDPPGLGSKVSEFCRREWGRSFMTKGPARSA